MALPEARHLLGRDVRREHEERRVPGEVEDDEDDDRDPEEHDQGLGQPARDVDAHGGAGARGPDDTRIRAERARRARALGDQAEPERRDREGRGRAAEGQVDRDQEEAEPRREPQPPRRRPHRPGRQGARPLPGRQPEQRAERVDRHVGGGGHAVRREPLAPLVDPRVEAREDERGGHGAGPRGESPSPQDGEDPELDQVAELPQAEVGRGERRGARPGREAAEQRREPLGRSVARQEARRAERDEGHPEEWRREACQAADGARAGMRAHGDRSH